MSVQRCASPRQRVCRGRGVFKGAELQLYVGPAVPVRVSRSVIDALMQITITTDTKGPSGFEMSFEISPRSPLHTLFLVSSGASIPMVRVIIAVTVNGTSTVLMDGVMTRHQISEGDKPGSAVMTVIGEDLSRVMDYIDFSGIPYPAMPLFARVTMILAKYAFLGIVPKVLPSVLLDVPNPLEYIPAHSGKDLDYIKMLAREVGYVFYMEPGPVVGVSTAYWGPVVKVGVPQPALNLGMDAHRNVESLDFSFDSERKTLPVVYIQNPQSKVSIPIAVGDITTLSPPLGLIPPLPKDVRPVKESAKYGPVRGALIAMAKAAQSDSAVTARGSLDVKRYGRVLKAKQLVGVRGAGHAFNGLYYVDKVKHKISRGKYTQSFELSRNGLLSTVPRVSA